jgi:cytochrome c551/c552
MSSFPKAALAMALVLAAGAGFAQGKDYPGIGRAATPAEVAAWDIDVRPDFKGLPRGSGSVARGQEVWEAKCASCHGVFGESNQVFNPIVGGTTADDVKTGRVATLKRTDYPGRTTLMKMASVSSLWDYINRAMPWAQPKSLTVEEVYAVTAYILHLGDVVPADFTLSDRNIPEVQQRLPNRNGMTTAHALWPGKEFGGHAKPDVAATACMKNCDAGARASTLPAFANGSHGNLAQQNRGVGPQRGVDTSKAAAAQAPAPGNDGKAVQAVLQKNGCTACHAAKSKLVGPSWADIAQKHEGKADYLAGKIKAGGSGVWGSITMPPQALGDEEARRIASWLATGAKP